MVYVLRANPKPLFGNKFSSCTLRQSTVAWAAIVMFVIACLSTAHAHIVSERPWHPVAAAYRTMLFFGNLQPVPWSRISDAYRNKSLASTVDRPARDYFSGNQAEIGRSIEQAFQSKDRHALYSTSTRGVSQLIRASIAAARRGLSDQAGAQRKLQTAEALYRAFADFVAQADPHAHKRIGRAWLTLANSLGSKGLLGVGKVDADAAAFASAEKEIADYLKMSFEPEKFRPRSMYQPVPEPVFAAGRSVKIAAWLPPGTNLNDQSPLPRLVLNFEERGIDEKSLPLIAYGDMLFDSPLIFGEPASSLGITCSTCHNRSDINQSFFIPGISHQKGAIDVRGSHFNPLFNDRRGNSLDIPSLRGLRFTGPYGRDGRFASLRDFTRNVIVSEFAGAEPTPFMLDSLVAYMLEFDFLPNAKVDRQGRLTDKASAAALRGEVLFRKPFPEMDGKSCATCHVPSANFLDRKAHNIGSTAPGYVGAREGSFDTPTLLAARFTAPYFHDGSLPTLESVVDWFNNRYELRLGSMERSDLVAYLNAVGDADEPYQEFKGRSTQFRLAWEELTTFASTLDTLLPKRDVKHAELLLATVASDLAADASGMSNLAAKPKVYELASLLARVRKSVVNQNWSAAKMTWETFKRRQQRYDEDMY